MQQGLLWLPLLAVFAILTWLGWLESQKVTAYRQWAAQFDRSKYDVLAVLGWIDQTLIWGRPARRGPTQLQSIQLDQLCAIQLSVDGHTLDWPAAAIPEGKLIKLVLLPHTGLAYEIPFTERSLAIAWWNQLNQAISS